MMNKELNNYHPISPCSHVNYGDNCINDEDLHECHERTWCTSNRLTSHSGSYLSSATLSVESLDSTFTYFDENEGSMKTLSVTSSKHKDLCRYPSDRKPLCSIEGDFRTNKVKFAKEMVRDKLYIDTSEQKRNEALLRSSIPAPPKKETIADEYQLELEEQEVDNCFLVGRNICSNSHFIQEMNLVTDDETQTTLDKAILLRHQLDEGNIDNKNEQTSKMFGSLDTFFRQNSIFCHSLESWYHEPEVKKDTKATHDDMCGSTPRNSSINPVARKKKIQYLQQNFSPFDIDQSELAKGSLNLNKYTTVESNTIRPSFSNTILFAASPKRNIRKKVTPPNVHEERNCNPLVDTSCGALADIPQLALVTTEDDERDDCDDGTSVDEKEDFFYYDSDPSNLTSPRNRASHRRQNSNAMKNREFIPFNLSSVDEDTCVQKVFEQMQAKRLLVWHRKSNNKTNNPPVAIHTWIEHGSQLASVLIQPKFCWRKNHGKESHERSILNISDYHSIDLLDISKIVASDHYHVDREQYPFVKKSCSFVIEAYERKLIFEARDTMARDDVVEGLKLLVARLGSKIIMGDGKVLDEFFSPMIAYVPGRIPSVFTD